MRHCPSSPPHDSHAGPDRGTLPAIDCKYARYTAPPTTGWPAASHLLGPLRNRCAGGNAPGATQRPSAPELPGRIAGPLPAQSRLHPHRPRMYSVVASVLDGVNRLSVLSDRAPCSPRSFLTGDAPFWARIENCRWRNLKVFRPLFPSGIRVRSKRLVQGSTLHGSPGLRPGFAC